MQGRTDILATAAPYSGSKEGSPNVILQDKCR